MTWPRQLAQLLPAADRVIRPGDRLVVGTGDLRKTPLSEAFLYYLLPEARPGTYYVEMDPGVANADDSRLADDLSKADVVILSRVWDEFHEPNDSQELGSDRPNRVLRRRFCTVLDLPLYELLERCDRVRARHAGPAPRKPFSRLPEPMRTLVVVPTYLEVMNIEEALTRAACARARCRHPRRRRLEPRRHRGARESAWPASSGTSTSSNGRRRPGSGPPTGTASRSGSNVATRCSSRWTPTSRTTPPPSPRSSPRSMPAPISRSGRATSRVARYRTGRGSAASCRGGATATPVSCSACGVRDMTSGYRAYRRSTLEAVDYGAHARSDTASRSSSRTASPHRGGDIAEVPIEFTDRVRGHSKMSPSVAFEELWLVTWWSIRDRPWLRRRRRARAAD